MVKPSVERQAETAKDSKPLTEALVGQQPWWWVVGGIAHRGVRVPSRDMAGAAEAVAAGTNMGRQDRLDASAQRPIGVPDNAGADSDLAVDSARTHGRDTVDELSLAHGPHLHGAGLAVHRAGLNEHGCDDVVAAVGVGEQLIKQVTPTGPVPQMVVRIDDRQIGLEDRLLAPIKPNLTDGKIICGGSGVGSRGHWRGFSI